MHGRRGERGGGEREEAGRRAGGGKRGPWARASPDAAGRRALRGELRPPALGRSGRRPRLTEPRYPPARTQGSAWDAGAGLAQGCPPRAASVGLRRVGGARAPRGRPVSAAMRAVGRREILLWASEVSGRRVAEPRDLADGAAVLALFESIWPGPAARQRRLLRRLGGSGNWEVVRALFQELGLPSAACNEAGVRAGRFPPSFTLLGMLFFLQALALTRDCTVDFAHPLEPSVARFLGSSEAVSVLLRGGALQNELPGGDCPALGRPTRAPAPSAAPPDVSEQPRPRGAAETGRGGSDTAKSGSPGPAAPAGAAGADAAGGCARGETPSAAPEPSGRRGPENWSAELLGELLGLLDRKDPRGADTPRAASDWRAVELVHCLAGEAAALQRRLRELEAAGGTGVAAEAGAARGGGGMRVQRLEAQLQEAGRERAALADALQAQRAESGALRRQNEEIRAAAAQEVAHLRSLLADKDMLLEEQTVLTELTETLQRSGGL